MNKVCTNKKAFELSLGVLVVAIVLIITMIVVIATFTNIWGKGAGELRKGTGFNQDSDNDDVLNLFDKCPCDSGSNEYQGCSSEDAIPDTPDEIKEAKKCLEES